MTSHTKDVDALLHDLRASLFQILSVFEIARKKRQELSKADTERIASNARFMKSLLDEAAGASPVSTTTRNVVDTAVCLFAHQSTLTLTIDEDCSNLELSGNAIDWTRILLNLMVNGYREAVAVEGSDPALKIEVSQSSQAADTVEIAVIDNGPGVPTSLEEKIFQRGFTTHDCSGGEGLGLAASRAAALSAGGNLTLDTSAKAGARFVVTIPVCAKAATPAPADEHSVGRLRILAVDDDLEILSTYEQIVALDGHTLEPASSAGEALSLIDAKEFDVILIDVRLLDMSAAAFFATLCESHPTMADRVIFATGDRHSSDTMEFLQNSGRPFLIKPFSFADLQNAFLAVSTSR